MPRASEVSRGTKPSKFPPGWHCYLLLCSDGSYYCGITADLNERLSDHASGKGSSYTKGTTPVALVWYELHQTRAAAARRERQLKGWRHAKKKMLAEGKLILSECSSCVWISLVPTLRDSG